MIPTASHSFSPLHRYISGDIWRHIYIHCLHFHKFCFSNICNLDWPSFLHWSCSSPISNIWHWPFLPHNTLSLTGEVQYHAYFSWVFFIVMAPFLYSPSSVLLSLVNFIISCQICSVLCSWCHFWSSLTSISILNYCFLPFVSHSCFKKTQI